MSSTKAAKERRKFNRSLRKRPDLRKPGSQFFVETLDGMRFPSIGYCSHYPPYEVFVCEVNKSLVSERIRLEVIGIINQ